MPTTEINARRFVFEVNFNDDGTTWTPIGGLDTWSHTPGQGKTDRTIFDDDGAPRHKINSRTHQVKLKGKLQLDATDDDRNAGQEAAEQWASETDDDSLHPFRIVMPGGRIWYWPGATAEVTLGGGGNDDVVTWECTIDCSGARTVTPA